MASMLSALSCHDWRDVQLAGVTNSGLMPASGYLQGPATARGWDMDRERQLHLAEAFQARHRAPRLLLLANAWDALSARIVEEAGYEAVATTSGGVNWVLGYADGEAAPWSEVVAATVR